MHYIQLCKKILNDQNNYPFCILEICQNIISFQEKRKNLIIYFVTKGYLLKDYRKVLSQVISNGDKGIAAERVTFLELRKIHPNEIDEFICNKKELKTISSYIHWFGKYRLIPFLTAFSYENLDLMKKYMSLVNKSRLTPDVEHLDFLSYIEFVSFEEICQFRIKSHES